MIGLWSFNSHLLGDQFHDHYAVARIALNIIFFCTIVYASATQPSSSVRGAPFNQIRFGTFALLGSYVLLIIGLFLHETRIKMPFGFVLYDWFTEVLRVSANVLIPAGAHAVVTRLLGWMGPSAKWWAFVGDFFVLTARIMALYYLGSLLAHQVLWLQVAQVDTVQTIMVRKNQFDVAFSILLWILAFFILFEAAVALWGDWRGEKDRAAIPRYYYHAIGASLALWVRTLAELIIVVRFHLKQHLLLRDTALSRDTVFGLFTVIFLFLIVRVFQDSSRHIDCAPLLTKMQEETRLHIVRQAQHPTNPNGVAPSMESILQAIGRNPTASLSSQTNTDLNNMPVSVKQDYLDGLVEYLTELRRRHGALKGVNFAREF
ncbi:uncharacterized protein BDR25DRAFT_10731 [Lindgomyces ingoldianus]|uniref:Uncharacterized protein n=1 Tax=Lindgomyces ingoldianus TaxID=673940 RepID=A0ACB6R0M5_9PLEO|nr:uncharacterized protein BDR25DRAFT_10731 [Lindgomyces ingoldianus]KAF2472650.1 hypothetical protein BDR25DRAFT_10731 [Lindgomyces ingoldianus]